MEIAKDGLKFKLNTDSFQEKLNIHHQILTSFKMGPLQEEIKHSIMTNFIILEGTIFNLSAYLLLLANDLSNLEFFTKLDQLLQRCHPN